MAKNEEKQNREEELEASLMRVQADYANFRRRTEEEQDASRKRAAMHVLKDMLAIVDNLELALSQTPKTERNDLYKGVELILGQLASILEENGVEKIQVEEFDLNLHEAILAEASNKPKGTILEVLQPGYTLAGQVLRTAKVKISSGEE